MNSSGPAPAVSSPRGTINFHQLLEPTGPEGSDVVWRELDSLFTWYDRRAFRNRVAYQVLKVLTLLLAAAVTVLAAQHAPSWLTAMLAAVVVAAEGIQQLFQLHANWISYRASAEALRQEAFAFVAQVPPYDTAQRRVVLAQAIRTVTTKESTTWAKTVRQPA
jgi:Protein of unknown function (DUF4231)